MKRFEGVDLTGLKEVANHVFGLLPECKVWLLEGSMGAGKTTLVKEIGTLLGVTDAMSSPTFAIVNEYLTQSGKMFHFDFYRISHSAEAWNIGTEEYFYSGYPCFVEWPDRIPDLVPDKYGLIKIHPVSDDKRDVEVSVQHE